MKEIFTILHEVNLFDKQIGLLIAEILLAKKLRGRRFELIIGPFDFFDVDLLFFIHLLKPVVHDLLLLSLHRPERVEEISRPHDLRVHYHLIYEMIGMCNQRVVNARILACLTSTSF